MPVYPYLPLPLPVYPYLPSPVHVPVPVPVHVHVPVPVPVPIYLCIIALFHPQVRRKRIQWHPTLGKDLLIVQGSGGARHACLVGRHAADGAAAAGNTGAVQTPDCEAQGLPEMRKEVKKLAFTFMVPRSSDARRRREGTAGEVVACTCPDAVNRNGRHANDRRPPNTEDSLYARYVYDMRCVLFGWICLFLLPFFFFFFFISFFF